MSSMKSFKSKISQKRSDSKSKINMSAQSVLDFNLQNVQMTARDAFQFRFQISGQKIAATPFRLQITNNSGCNIFLYASCSKEEYFTISPKKYLLQNGSTYEITTRLVEMDGVTVDEYAKEKFTIAWGRISQSDINNKIIPQLTHKRQFKCFFHGKEKIDELQAQLTYKQIPGQYGPTEQKSRNFLDVSKYSNNNRSQQLVKSGLDINDLYDHPMVQRQSLLKMNIIIAVAVISFIIGFLSS